MILNQINGPQDLKKLNLEELNQVSQEIRDVLIKKLQVTGGHVGPNLGVVELTTALHYVFDSPKDKIVYDISHQCYTHKILTGRKEAFMNPEKYGSVTGFTSTEESEHDVFTIGHTSTSVSLATGLAKARNLAQGKESIIALIGDGSLSGGEAFEGLNTAGALDGNLIIIVNDNDQSIAENHGGLYTNLKELRESHGQCENNLFKALGLDYVFLNDGHDIEKLVQVLKELKETEKPTVLHVVTTKGKGYSFAEINREAFHYSGPFEFETGKSKWDFSGPNYQSETAKYLLKKMESDPLVAHITPGTPVLGGFTKENRIKAKDQFIDVGIAEAQAIAMAAGMARNKAKPVVAVSSSFIQRTYDQLSQDLCLDSNPAVILVGWASTSGSSDKTHLGLFDIPLLSSIPNLVYLAPTCKEEYFAMLDWAIEQTAHPVAIRIPSEYSESGIEDKTNYGQINHFDCVKQGKDVAILGLGNFFKLAQDVVDKLEEQGISATLINPKYITGLDEAMLEKLKESHNLVITLEDGMVEGGFGEKIARFYGPSDMKVKNYGIKKGFPDRYDPKELLKENGISVEQIVAFVQSING
ncbi:MAG: 1-deoxy-D-xylulose-5-phosphate synthase [Anaerorhabdus sp.]